MPEFDAAVFIGRFQPPHLGHVAMLTHALSAAQSVIVVLGSAFQARTPKNPFTWQERQAMIEACFAPDQRERLQFLPIADFYDEARWVQAVQAGVQALVAPQAANTPARVALMAHFKDASSQYLRQFPTWHRLDFPRQNHTDATAIRDALFASDATEAAQKTLRNTLEEHVAPAVVPTLLQWRSTDAFVALQEEWHILKGYRESWATAPYPPVFVTVDALVQCQGKVLLVERGQAPGKGLFALPGGFLEQRDTLWQSCLRELQEETCIDLSEAQWRQALQNQQLFDHPDRSLRGRVITQVFHFDLGNLPLPTVQGADDAKAAFWWEIAQIQQHPERFFDDHFHILESLLNTPPHQTWA